jgi:hypothetical protein
MNYGFGRWALGLREPGAISGRQTVPLLFFMTLAALALFAIRFSAPRIGLLALVVTYALCIAGGSIWIAARKGWRHVVFLPAALMTMHVAYALGSLKAFTKRVRR